MKIPKSSFLTLLKSFRLENCYASLTFTKPCDVSSYNVFHFLLLLVFQNKNLFRFLNSKRKGQAISKNTYYRFLNDTSFNWTKFILLLSVKVIDIFRTLTRSKRAKVFVLDDSVIKHNRSKAMELLVPVYNHVEYKYQEFTRTV